ncbi:hypothetical protein MPTK1_1g20210 [Marchantia polymorpha subsp. ruderalis]|uniref:Uncharacterized protein n=2 Tax=Marchantia polymorpha TaxID=3197 RepID=A0AAF6AS70_MARPO|nr:hypothetical protein MARPO_0001s0358 [Marchantia polymorpha]BBM99290.1 hypothetical protein Mp_1g20210 [Marchantia polymorpha subsp. ruderalis]|eukprot:PTQ50372.1 hypothetical protein MARPO_0001s0358 [Marchantia polymorpha]
MHGMWTYDLRTISSAFALWIDLFSFVTLVCSGLVQPSHARALVLPRLSFRQDRKDCLRAGLVVHVLCISRDSRLMACASSHHSLGSFAFGTQVVT